MLVLLVKCLCRWCHQDVSVVKGLHLVVEQSLNTTWPLKKHLTWSKTHIRDTVQFLHWGVNVTLAQISCLNDLKVFCRPVSQSSSLSVPQPEIQTESLAASFFPSTQRQNLSIIFQSFVFELLSFKFLFHLDLLVFQTLSQSCLVKTLWQTNRSQNTMIKMEIVVILSVETLMEKLIPTSNV